MDTSNVALFLALLCSVAIVHSYKTEAPNFSNEPLTTLPPITAQQQSYILLLNFVSGNLVPGQGDLDFPGLRIPLMASSTASNSSGIPVQGISALPPAPQVPLSRIPLSRVPLSGVPPSGVTLSGVPPSGVPLSGVPPSGVPLSGVPLSGVPPSGVPLSGVPPFGVPLSGVPPSGVPLSGVPPSGVPQAPFWAPPAGVASNVAAPVA